MTQIAIQYLEPNTVTKSLSPKAVRARLREALSSLQINMVLLGWDLPTKLVDTCREETTKAGAALYLWHPLLTGNGILQPKTSWQTVGLSGDRVPGFRGMPEFTFVCPNNPDAKESALQSLEQVLRDDMFDGVFLDRMRFPAPMENPTRVLACFCPSCQQVTHLQDLDLKVVKSFVHRVIETPPGIINLLRGLLGKSNSAEEDILFRFLEFRERTISQFVQRAIGIIRSHGLQVGLDCFSPFLTCTVGQNLGDLDPHADWTKVMIYTHTLGPAGIPFELLGLANWMVATGRFEESEALNQLAKITGLPIPLRRDKLAVGKMPPEILSEEIHKAKSAGVRTCLAGIELVEINGVTFLNEEQIKNDLLAIQEAGADGLALSWDLWHMPAKNLEIVGKVWNA